MTNQQLYLAIGVPLLVNLTVNGVLILLVYTSLSAQIAALERTMNARLDDLKEMWRTELHRVEEVLDARLKHVEENQRNGKR